MNKISYIVLFFLILPFNTYSNSEINISTNKGIIDTTISENNSNILFSGYNHSKFDLFKIYIPDNIKIIKHDSRTIIKQGNDFILDRKPKILDFLISKIGIEKISNLIDNGFLHIIGDTNKTGSNFHNYSSDYYLSNNDDGLSGKYFDITHKFIVNNTSNSNIEIYLNPFEKNIFLGYRIGGEPPYPLLSIFDNSLLPQDLKLIVNNKIYYPKINYNIQGYKINTPYIDEGKKLSATKNSYVFLPRYTFNLDLYKGKSIIELNYKKLYFDDSEIIIQESY